MAQPVFPIYNVPLVPNPQMVIRSRREIDTRDAVNARQFEHWQTDGKHGTMNRPDLNKQAPFHDVLPINSRTNERNYRSQPRYEVDGHRGNMNPYFDKYDTTYDARNTVRELRATVYEDKSTGYLAESRHLLERNFDNRWLDTTQVKRQLEATESLRPQMDDITKFYTTKPTATK